MSTPPNKYRDLHRAVESLANQASGLGLYDAATALWGVAAQIKERGRPLKETSSGSQEGDDLR